MNPTPIPELDPDDVRVATGPDDVLAQCNLAGVFGPAEVHGARTLAALVGEPHPDVALAAALALRAPLHGHVCVDLNHVEASAAVADDSPVTFAQLPWPDPPTWRAQVAASPLVRVRPEGTPDPTELQPADDRPLVLVGSRLYLDRYWRYERRVATALRRRAERSRDGADPARVRAILDVVLPAGTDHPDRQRLAVAGAALRALTVIAGGPGTGKTHTVARMLALWHELAGGDAPHVAVAAPTGKAADRLTAALRAAADDLPPAAGPAVRAWLRGLEGSTLHRLLGWHPGSATRFRHDRTHKLAHDAVIVDETSMVDLPLLSKLLEAMSPAAALVLVGDPDQLASVEAGAVLADIVGPSGAQLHFSPEHRDVLEAATGEPLSATAGGRPVVAAPRPGGIDDAVIVLGTLRRYRAGSGIARLAAAVHAGDADAAVEVLRSDAPDVEWIETSGDAEDTDALTRLRQRVVAAGRWLTTAARAGDGAAALAAFDRVRVLCAHRRGAVGVTGWVPLIERWLTAGVDGFEAAGNFYIGRPVMVTRNDRRLRLFNGDVGIVVRAGDTVQVAFPGAAGVRTFAPSRLEDVETVHAMTIHKSQGSQFGHVVVVLPNATSQILTRELLYTAVTRAESGVTLVATEAAVRGAIDRRVARASGLRATLWPAP